MTTIKKAQLGGLIKKGVKAATKATPKKNPVSKIKDPKDLLSDKSLDWANSPAMDHYLKNKKPAPNLRKAQQKVNERKASQTKQVDDSYNTSGPAIKVKRKNGGPVNKAKNGKSFPDLNKDGKVTKADILKGRGVIAKKGATIKKAQAGKKLKLSEKYSKTADSLSNEDLRKMTAAGKMTVNRKEPRWKQKTDSLVKSADKDFKGSLEARKKSYELRKKGLKTGGSVSKKMKNGGSMKKCKYGCK
jgi:hypothetical protein